MKYGSVCSGIEAATAAWHPLGWEPSFFSEIEKFPRAVLQHHYPDIPLHGDFTTIQENDYDPIDLLVGGTPCQSFSIAGLRGGMDDDRGNLALEYLKLARRKRPQWLVWENVPGVLSSNGGRDFGSFLGALGELGYGFTYRVLDAQYFGVPQRRRRVFVIGYFGDWRPAAAVLFERESLRRNNPPSRKAKQDIAGTISSRTTAGGGLGTDFDLAGGLQVAGTLAAGMGRRRGAGQSPEALIPTAFGGNNTSGAIDVSTAVKGNNGNYDFESETFFVCHGTQDPCINQNLAHTLGRNHGAENAIAIQTAHTSSNGDDINQDNIAYTLDQTQGQAVAFAQNSRDEVRIQGGDGQITGALSANEGMKQRTYIAGSVVRRLTPIECERLQGFEDEFTRIPWRNKSAEECPDGPRYKAIGNSMAVPVMHWLGQRIEMVDQLLKQLKIA